MHSSGTSLADVAQAAGVSKATASRALRGLPGVAQVKVEAVAAAALRLGYRPDPVLAAFSRYRWPAGARTAGAVLAHLVDDWTSQQAAIVSTVAARCRDLGYRTDLIRIAPDYDAALLRRRLRDAGYLGVLVNVHDDRLHLDLSWQHLCGVVIGEGQPHLAIPRVGTDWMRLTADAARRLRAMGHTRIGCIVRRFAGSELTGELHDAALSVRHHTPESAALPILETPGSVGETCALAAVWWKRYHPTAVIADIPSLAVGLAQGGAVIPRSCSFITLTDGGADATGLSVSGYTQEWKARAIVAIEMLHSRILHGKRGISDLPPRLLLPGRWVPGQTLAAVDNDARK